MHVDYHWMPALSACLIAICLIACAMPISSEAAAGQISKEPFGKLPDGTAVDLYTLRNRHGMEVKISNYGGIVVSINVPDRNGQLADVTLGYDNLDGYLKETPYFGALVGRYGNRIANAKFTLDGKEFKLAANNGSNSLHGGLKGFDKVVWQAKSLATPEGPALELSYISKDGEEGFPGTLSVSTVYALTDDNGLKIEYTATTDKDTVINLTHHSYFNLAGKGEVLNHEVMIHADKFTPTDKSLIPTGELRSVNGTPFDFRKPTAIGARINQDDEQLKIAGGYDQNWVIDKPPGKLGLMARVYEPTTGRVLEVFSTEPGMQFYTGNHLNSKITGKGNRVYTARSGFCMEPQHYPDSPNRPEFPSAVLKPRQEYQNTIIYRFSVRK